MGFLNIIGLILPIILFSLGTLHVYWALGGNWGASGAIPTKDGIALFKGMYRKVCKWLKLGTGLQSEWQAG